MAKQSRNRPGKALVVAAITVLASFAGCPNPQAPPPPGDPTPPTGAVIVNGNDAYTVVTSVTLTLTVSDDSGATGLQMMVCNSDDFAGASWEAFAVTRDWTLSPGDGPKAVYVKFRDAAGNESEAYDDSILLDPAAPGPPGAPDLFAADDIGISDSDNTTRQTTGLSFSGAGAESDATVKVYDSIKGLMGSTVAGPSGNWSLDLELEEGTYALFARTVASVGESPASAPLLVTVDTTPPGGVPGILRPMQGENTGANQRPRFSWTATAGADAYQLQADHSPAFDSIDYDWKNLTGVSHVPASDMDASGSVPVGTRYFLRARALDIAGNEGGWSNTELLRYVNVGRFDNDFNGDGSADAIVGAYGYSSYQGRAYIYFGGTAMDNTADLTLTGEEPGNYFGISVASAGDVNADGFADAIVGAHTYDSSRGRAYVYYGGASMDAGADLTLAGETTLSLFGISVASAGDTNGDGYADAIVGADGYYGFGHAYLYHGGSTMDGGADLILTGEASEDRFGHSVASAGDMNGDGYAELFVGSQNHENWQGRAYVYCGGPSMDNTADLTVTGEASSGFGFSVASAGDINGDGYADAIVGATIYASYKGKAYIYLGGPSLDNSVDLSVEGEAADDQFGFSVASAGDMNRDGYSDWLVGAKWHGSNAGRAYLYCGGSSADSSADLVLDGEAAMNNFGWSAASAGDVNGDGYADAIVGAFYFNAGQGRAYIYHGSSSLDNGADLIMDAEAAGSAFGCSVASGGKILSNRAGAEQDCRMRGLAAVCGECVLEDRRTRPVDLAG